MPRKRIYCANCNAGQICDPHQVADLLRVQGMLRREAEPDNELLQSLLESTLPKMSCGDCGASGLDLDPDFDDAAGQWDDWGETTKACLECGMRLPPERLELYPNAEYCAACESAPAKLDEEDYCPRCGTIRVLKTAGSGVTRYRYYVRDARNDQQS